MRICCVPNCKTRWVKDISLHSFPSNIKERLKWKKSLGINKEITKSLQVCYLHFKPEDYLCQELLRKNILKKGVIPSFRPPQERLPLRQSKEENINSKGRPARERLSLTQSKEGNSRSNCRPTRERLSLPESKDGNIHSNGRLPQEHLSLPDSKDENIYSNGRPIQGCLPHPESKDGNIYANVKTPTTKAGVSKSSNLTSRHIVGEIVTNIANSLNESANNIQENRRRRDKVKVPRKKKRPLTHKKRKRPVSDSVREGQPKSKKTVSLKEVEIEGLENDCLIVPVQLQGTVASEKNLEKSDRNHTSLDCPIVPVKLHGTVASEENFGKSDRNHTSPSAVTDEQSFISDVSEVAIKEELPDLFESNSLVPDPDISMKVHVPDFIDCEARPKQKECMVCFKKVLSKEVCTYCPDCPETPPLCLQPCFREYHGY